MLLRSLLNLASRVHFYLCQTRVRYLISTILLLIGGMMTSDFEKGRQSTFICPITSGHYPRLRLFKVLSTLLDCVILVGAGELAPKGGRSRDGRGRKQTLISWGLGFLVRSRLDSHNRSLLTACLTGSRLGLDSH